MKTTTLVAMLAVVLAGCMKKQQVMDSGPECIAAKDAATRAAAACEKCCVQNLRK